MPHVDNAGVKIFYRVEGNGTSLVLLHGFTESSERWYELGYVHALQAKHRLILIDSRGHGQSDKPHDAEAYTAEKHASDVTAVLDGIGLQASTFWGYSQGGWIGFALAKFAANRISAFIIGGATASGASAFPSVGGSDPLIQALKKGPDAMIGMYGDAVSPAHAARLRASDLDALLACRRQRLVSGGYPDVPGSISVSTLIYAGTADPIYDHSRDTASQIAKAQFFSLDGLGHVQAWVKSDLVLPHVQSFLSSFANTAA
jgi:pimeloyl-ACP methyl ester carboxylesterase